MNDKINEALEYANSNSKLEGLELSDEEKNLLFDKIEKQENNVEFVQLVKLLVKEQKEEKGELNGKVR